MVFGLSALKLDSLARAQIPHQAARYRADLTRQARQVWGLDAPVATFAAQVHTESRWRADAISPVGARGMAQFMPDTEAWMGRLDPSLNTSRERSSTGAAASGSATPAGAMNPAWALRALVTYDRWLWDRLAAADDCERMAMTLAAYNGGLGWVQRDRAITPPALRNRWFGGVEGYNAGRHGAAIRENRAYPHVILRVHEPLYVAANWGPGSCA